MGEMIHEVKVTFMELGRPQMQTDFFSSIHAFTCVPTQTGSYIWLISGLCPFDLFETLACPYIP